MVMSIPLLGLGFNLNKVEFEGKKRTLERLGYDFGDLKFSQENNAQLKTIYDSAKLVASPIGYLSNSEEVDAWLCGEDNKCTDGKDDGHISGFSKTWNFVEGMAKTVIGSLRSLMTDKKKCATFVATAAIMAGVLCFGGPIGAAIVTVTGITGAIGLIANGVKDFITAAKIADNAESDAEAKAAFEQMGSGTLQVGVGVYCGRQALNSIGVSPKKPPVFEDEFIANLEDVSVLVDKP